MSDTLPRTQEMWPFGPAPTRECVTGGQHDWRIIDLARMAEPPAPSFQCAKCAWRWSRAWTNAEFAAWLAPQDQGSRDYYGISLGTYRDEPAYADG